MKISYPAHKFLSSNLRVRRPALMYSSMYMYCTVYCIPKYYSAAVMLLLLLAMYFLHSGALPVTVNRKVFGHIGTSKNIRALRSYLASEELLPNVL